MSVSSPVVLDFIAHPDELIGAGAAVIGLSDAGRDVVVVPCGGQSSEVDPRPASWSGQLTLADTGLRGSRLSRLHSSNDRPLAGRHRP
jgi:hypothetical protein